MKSKHTPGPWEVRPTRAGLEVGMDVTDAKGNLITCTGCQSNEQDCANAHLIAAAPAMLEALKSVASTFAEPKQDFQAEKNSIKHSYSKVCAAIQFAEGEK